MRNTLLTTTALVLVAGIASADGHASISWSGTATAGVARIGEVAAVKAVVSTASNTVFDTAFTKDSGNASAALARTDSLTLQDAKTALVSAAIATAGGATMTHTGTTLVGIRADLAAMKLESAGALPAAANKIILASITLIEGALDFTYGVAPVAAVKAGDFQTYSKVKTTVSGSVTAGDTTMTAAVSVDAGQGYDFADDDGFDTSATGSVSLDNVTIASSIGTFKIDQNAVAHLVDAGDDETGDILYTNTFGTMSVSVVVDANKDSDDTAKKAVAGSITAAHSNSATTQFANVAATAAVAADVAWSAKVSMPLGTGSAYVAMDEEGGNIFGAAATVGGIGLTFSSKLEALEEELSIDRDNSIGATYVMGATTLGATWNSVEDKDQWGISAAYSADGMTLNASTDEGSDWSVSGSYLMGTGASVVGGVNYTEDAYLGLSFSF